MIKLKHPLLQRDYEPTTGGFKTFNNDSPIKDTMNEKIKQLAEQAGEIETINVISYDGDTMETVVSTEFNKEKFAELIVKECVSVLDPNGEYTEKYKNSHTPGPNGLRTILPEEHFYEMKAANKLKEHFGVEE